MRARRKSLHVKTSLAFKSFVSNLFALTPLFLGELRSARLPLAFMCEGEARCGAYLRVLLIFF